MLLTISTTHEPATELGYLLHKNPARAQTFELSFGKAHVLYPEASDTPTGDGASTSSRLPNWSYRTRQRRSARELPPQHGHLSLL
jgi:hypothetical protein